MPSLGADMNEATVVEWLKDEGDAVHRGEVIAVVETVKGAIEIEVFEDGVLDKVEASVGDAVSVGEVLAHIASKDAKAVSGVETVAPNLPKKKREEPASINTRTKVQVSPAALKRAAELGIDISKISSGEDGIIGLAEVEAQSTGSKTEAPAKRTTKQGLDLDAMRQAIGAAMARSKREIPHFYVGSTLDLSRLLDWLEDGNKHRSVEERILYAAPLIKAVAMALKKSPVLNGFFEDDQHQLSEDVHLGVTTSLRGGGLIAPAMHNTDTLTTGEVMVKLRGLVSRVRTGRLRGSEMTDPTATISILGDDTADSLLPVIYPPQVAIIGCGAIRSRPWIVDDLVEVRRTMVVTVAADHRVGDGRGASRFLNHLNTLLQEPETL